MHPKPPRAPQQQSRLQMKRVLISAALGLVLGFSAQAKDAVLVVGATGQSGALIVDALLKDGYTVRAMARDPAKAKEKLAKGAEIVMGDVRDPASLKAAAAGTKKVVFAASASAGGRGDMSNSPEKVDYEGAKNTVDAAKAAGADQIVLLSSAGVTQPDHPLNARFNNILQWKLKGEDYLRASGIAYTVIRPLGLRDYAGDTKGVRFLQGDKIAAGKEISRADVAAITVAAFKDPAARGKTFEIHNDDALAIGAWRKDFTTLKADPLK
jgi:uncharacterized protein YbjT (DUF2867 family)